MRISESMDSNDLKIRPDFLPDSVKTLQTAPIL